MTNADERERQVERLLGDDRAKEVFTRYASDWLTLHEAGKTVLDETMYPEYTPALGEAIVEETRAFIDAYWDEALPYEDIFTAKFAYANRQMAEIYGFENPRDGMNRYDLTGNPHRFGILTQAALLGPSGVNPDEPSMVFRGQYLLKKFLCAEPPELTPEVREAIGDDIEAARQESEGKTERWAADKRAEGGTCGACHSQFDALAYALEPYDALGRRRTMDRFGNTLRDDGQFTGSMDPEERSFANTQEFAEIFATLPRVRACLAANAMRFMTGRELHLTKRKERCLVESVTASIEEPNASFKDLFRAMALHPLNQGFLTLEKPEPAAMP